MNGTPSSSPYTGVGGGQQFGSNSIHHPSYPQPQQQGMAYSNTYSQPLSTHHSYHPPTQHQTAVNGAHHYAMTQPSYQTPSTNSLYQHQPQHSYNAPYSLPSVAALTAGTQEYHHLPPPSRGQQVNPPPQLYGQQQNGYAPYSNTHGHYHSYGPPLGNTIPPYSAGTTGQNNNGSSPPKNVSYATSTHYQQIPHAIKQQQDEIKPVHVQLEGITSGRNKSDALYSIKPEHESMHRPSLANQSVDEEDVSPKRKKPEYKSPLKKRKMARQSFDGTAETNDQVPSEMSNDSREAPSHDAAVVSCARDKQILEKETTQDNHFSPQVVYANGDNFEENDNFEQLISTNRRNRKTICYAEEDEDDSDYSQQSLEEESEPEVKKKRKSVSKPKKEVS